LYKSILDLKLVISKNRFSVCRSSDKNSTLEVIFSKCTCALHYAAHLLLPHPK